MNKLKDLIEVRKLVALSLTALFCIMSLRGQFEPRDVYTAILMVISYYYGKSNPTMDKSKE